MNQQHSGARSPLFSTDTTGSAYRQKSPCKNPHHNRIPWQEIRVKVQQVDLEGVLPSNNQY
jgi:hypothetical protein